MPRLILLAMTALLLGCGASAAQEDVGRLETSIRSAVGAKGKAFETDIRTYFESFLLVRICNSLNDRQTRYIENAELSGVRWWLHSFQNALKLEEPVLTRVGIRVDAIWQTAERNTETFRLRATPARLGETPRADALRSAEIALTCRSALDVFRSHETAVPDKLSF